VQTRLAEFVRQHTSLIEEQLRRRLPESTLAGAGRLNEALHYVVATGGKRLRPLLTLASAAVFDVPASEAAATACGVEYLHLSSVILDDLPAMDDAPMRRHMPTLHVAFDQATAILAALALYTRAFELFAPHPALVCEAAESVGSEGMIGGQAADLAGASPARLRKTTALMRFALRAGGRLGNAQPPELEALGRFGEVTGEAFQLCDDLLDALASEQATGKTAGQDKRHNRQALAPDSEARTVLARIGKLTDCAQAAVRRQLPPGAGTDLLCDFAGAVLQYGTLLLYGNPADSADAIAAGFGGRQRAPLAADQA